MSVRLDAGESRRETGSMSSGALPPSDRTRANELVRQKFDEEAPGYDKEMDFWERYLFGSEHRAWACSRAKGDVLEVAIGTGLNLPHYPPGVHLTGVDLSAEMLALADARARDLRVRIDLKQADAQELPFEDRSYDTVVCTYALCSVPDVAAAVHEMRRVLRPNGRLILVDHVRSTKRLLLWLQKAYEYIRPEDHLTRRPAVQVMDADLFIQESDRLRLGIVERLAAVKPG